MSYVGLWMTRTVVLAVPLLVGATWEPARANEKSDFRLAIERLHAATTIRCEWDVGTKIDWNPEEEPSAKVEAYGSDSSMSFDLIDLNAGTARMVADHGASDVTAKGMGSGMLFVEADLNFTTVTTNMTERGRYKAIHSRHFLGLGPGLMPQQFVGECEVQR